MDPHALIEQIRAAHAQDPQVAALIRQLFSPDGRDPESLRFKVNVGLVLRNEAGDVLSHEVHQLICTAGKNKVLDSTSGAKYPKDYAYVCIGTGTTAAVIGNTALETELVRALGTVSNPSAGTLRVTYTFPAGTGTGAITEAGLDYQNTPSGAILCRQVFAVNNKGASDTLQVYFDIS